MNVPNGQKIGIILHVEEGEGEPFAVSLDVPEQGAIGLAGKAGRIDEDGNFQVDFPMIGASLNLAREDDKLVGVFFQGIPLPVTFGPADDLPAPIRPQEDALVRDYVIQEVTFPGGADGVTLSGELTRPKGDGPFPGAVLISGSGPQDRNEELMAHKPFLILSDYLTRNGYAVLRYDDRGTAESTGEWDSATTQDFANDAAAALAFLRTQEGIETARAGYVGHSEGGFIAPLATKVEPANFMVFLAGPSQPLPDVIIRQSIDMGKAAGTPEAVLTQQTEMQANLFDALKSVPTSDEAYDVAKQILTESGLVPPAAIEAQAERMSSPWMLWMMTFDPRPEIAAYNGPILALFGDKDLQVAPDANETDMRLALKHPKSVVKTLPGLNHLFQPAETGAMTEYYSIETTFDESAMAEIVAWLDGLGE